VGGGDVGSVLLHTLGAAAAAVARGMPVAVMARSLSSPASWMAGYVQNTSAGVLPSCIAKKTL
jgi:hypothetical protein